MQTLKDATYWRAESARRERLDAANRTRKQRTFMTQALFDFKNDPEIHRHPAREPCTHLRMHAHTRARTRAHTRAHARAHTHTNTHMTAAAAHTNTHTHTHGRTWTTYADPRDTGLSECLLEIDAKERALRIHGTLVVLTENQLNPPPPKPTKAPEKKGKGKEPPKDEPKDPKKKKEVVLPPPVFARRFAGGYPPPLHAHACAATHACTPRHARLRFVRARTQVGAGALAGGRLPVDGAVARARALPQRHDRAALVQGRDPVRCQL